MSVGGKHLVLIVDDSPTLRQKLDSAVRNQGHATCTAADGAAALARMAEGGVDLVLLDIVMPGMDGFEVLRRMAEDPLLREIPVLVVSSLEQMSDVVAAIELGATDFLTKSFDPVLLRARITTCLERKRLRDQELDYLRQVDHVAQAAHLVESRDFHPGALGLDEVAARPDALGGLARVFRDMAGEVYRREMAYRRQISLLKGSFLLLLIGLCWGLVPALSRMMMVEVDESIGAAAWVVTGSAILMIIWCAIRGHWPRFTRRRVVFAGGLALAGTVLPQVVMFTVAEHVPAMLIAIALAMETMFVFLAAAALGMESPDIKRFAGLCLGMVCVALLVVPEQGVPGLSNPVWLLVALLVPLGYGTEGILMAMWPDDDEPDALVLLLMLASVVILWPITFAVGEYVSPGVLYMQSGLMVPAISALSCVATVLLLLAVRTTGAVFASQSAYAVAGSGVVWGMLLLNEVPTAWVWAALACMISGLVLVRPKDDATEA